MAIVTLATNRSRWLLHGILALSFAFGLAFNVIGPVQLVTEQNIQRALHPELVAPGGETGLDIFYLASLGDDALPLLAAHRCDLHLSGAAKFVAHGANDPTRNDEAGKAWQAWNLSRERRENVRFPEDLPSAPGRAQVAPSGSIGPSHSYSSGVSHG